MEPTEVEGYITNQIIIRRVLTNEDKDVVFVDWPDDGPLLELLGMLEYARTLIWEFCTNPPEEEDEDGNSIDD